VHIASSLLSLFRFSLKPGAIPKFVECTPLDLQMAKKISRQNIRGEHLIFPLFINKTSSNFSDAAFQLFYTRFVNVDMRVTQYASINFSILSCVIIVCDIKRNQFSL
jgi:hypothetical protein